MYEFSAPMPYSIEYIEKLSDINTQVQKSKICSLYASLPANCDMFCGFEQSRNLENDKIKFDYWKELIIYTKSKGMDFIYLLNNPMPFNTKDVNFMLKINKMDKLLEELKKIGINKLRVAAPQLLSYLAKHYPYFKLYSSTSLDYRTLSEYQNFINFHPEIRQLVPSHDINKNFTILENLKKEYTNIEIELMVNEGCMYGCPHRMLHEMFPVSDNSFYTKDFFLSERYCTAYCSYVARKFPFYSLTLSKNIFPWDLKEYKKIGINKFKLVGRDSFPNQIAKCINAYYVYLKTIENYDFARNIPINTFIYHLSNNKELNNLTVYDCKKYLPKISHFQNKGHLCASICGVDCRYCYKCAEKIQKVFFTKQEEERKRHISVCFINNI